MHVPARHGPYRLHMYSLSFNPAAGLMQTKAMIRSIHLGFLWMRNILVLRQWNFGIHQLQQQTLITAQRVFFYVKWKNIGYINDMPKTGRYQYLLTIFVFPFFFLIEENLSTVKCKDLKWIRQKVLMNFYSYITNTLNQNIGYVHHPRKFPCAQTSQATTIPMSITINQFYPFLSTIWMESCIIYPFVSGVFHSTNIMFLRFMHTAAYNNSSFFLSC